MRRSWQCLQDDFFLWRQRKWLWFQMTNRRNRWFYGLDPKLMLDITGMRRAAVHAALCQIPQDGGRFDARSAGVAPAMPLITKLRPPCLWSWTCDSWQTKSSCHLACQILANARNEMFCGENLICSPTMKAMKKAQSYWLFKGQMVEKL